MRTRPETLVQDAVVTVEPGQMAQTVLTVRNVGDEIAEYDVSLVPDCVAAPWAEASPATFRLMPGKDQQVTLRFRPPLDSSTPAGSFPYGVLVAPKEDRHQAPVVVEGDLAVGAVHALDVRLKPPRSRGRWRGRHTVELRNQGTEDVRVKLSVADDDEALSFALAPTTVTVPPRQRADAFLRIRSRSPRLLGRPSDHAFALTYRRRADSRVALAGVPSDGEVAVEVPGSFTHKPLIPKWLLVLLALLAVGAVLLLTLRPWESPPPRRPPAPLDNVTMISHTDDEVIVSWDTRPNVSAVELREVECATAADVIPVGVGEVTSVETSGTGRQMYTLAGLAGAPERCFQARALADDEASIWAPRPAVRVRLGQTLPPPADVTAEHAGDCAVAVGWAALAPEDGDVQYQVIVDGAPVGSAQPTTSLSLPDQEAGATLEVSVEAAVGQLRSAASEPVEVEVPDPCVGVAGDPAGGDAAGTGADGGGDDGDGEDDDSSDGSSSTTAGSGILQLEDRYWLLILPPAGQVDQQTFKLWVTQWQVFGAAEVQLGQPPQPRLGTVGVDVALPEDLGETEGFVIPPGTSILYVDLYQENEIQARADCGALNREGEQFEFIPFSPPCRLVHPDGKVEDIPPAA